MVGCLIVLEGVDHSGKTTQRTLLVERLRAAGYEVVETREPGGTPYAERIRELILKGGDGEVIYPETELLLFSAARCQHVRNVILPQIKAGKVVVCDRFIMSSFAYQVWPYKDEPDNRMMDLFYGLMPFVVGEIPEPLTLFLNLPPEERAARALTRGKEINHLDTREAAFYAKVNEGLTMASETQGVVTIDANREIPVITDELFEISVNYIKNQQAEAERLKAAVNDLDRQMQKAQEEIAEAIQGVDGSDTPEEQSALQRFINERTEEYKQAGTLADGFTETQAPYTEQQLPTRQEPEADLHSINIWTADKPGEGQAVANLRELREGGKEGDDCQGCGNCQCKETPSVKLD